MKQKQTRHIIDILFVISLFCLFALCAIFLISMGARIYGKTMTNMNDNFEDRTAMAYITQKVHQSDAKDSVYIGFFGDGSSIILNETINDVLYETYIYSYEGNLMELTTRADVTLSPKAGQIILPVSDFLVQAQADNLIYCEITPSSDQKTTFYIHTRTGGLQ